MGSCLPPSPHFNPCLPPQPYLTFSGVNDGFNDPQGRSIIKANDTITNNFMINGYSGGASCYVPAVRVAVVFATHPEPCLCFPYASLPHSPQSGTWTAMTRASS